MLCSDGCCPRSFSRRHASGSCWIRMVLTQDPNCRIALEKGSASRPVPSSPSRQDLRATVSPRPWKERALPLCYWNSLFFISADLSGKHTHMILICVSSVTSEVGHFSVCFSLYFSLFFFPVHCLFVPFAHFSNEVVFFFLTICNALIIVD